MKAMLDFISAQRILLESKQYRYLKEKIAIYASVLKIIGALVIPLLIIILPPEWLLIKGLTITQHRTVFIFAVAAIFWITEPIPVFATSILIIFLELILLSDSALNLPFTDANDKLGEVLSFREIMSVFGSPIIILFLGGFFLAISATKYKLDQVMARTFIKPFGTNPKFVMLGLMSITAVFSMFMSNTATTAMMLSILVPVIASMDENDKGKIGFVLCIPFAANIGGIGTPIGTPPNALAMKYLNGSDITFGKWMLMGVPYVIVMLLIGWLVISKMFPTTTKSIHLKIDAKNKLGKKAIVVYATFTLTLILWLTDFIHGMNSYVVALFPVVVFLCLNILGKDDLKLISWDVLWLVAGGLALGLALEKTGLVSVIAGRIPFSEFSIYVIFILFPLTGLFIATFMSNTATANLLLPFVMVIGSNIAGLDQFGGGKMLILATTFSISLAMCLPISTPPNALAYSTGLISTRYMVKTGLVLGVIGVILVFTTLFIGRSIGLL